MEGVSQRELQQSLSPTEFGNNSKQSLSLNAKKPCMETVFQNGCLQRVTEEQWADISGYWKIIIKPESSERVYELIN